MRVRKPPPTSSSLPPPEKWMALIAHRDGLVRAPPFAILECARSHGGARRMRILVIEDEKKVASFVQRGLEAEHYAVDVVHDGESGLARAVDRCYDLVILDVMLPKRDGYAVLRELRGRDSTLPVLLLTARSAVADRVLGLDLGADDYLTKPFEFAELLARVRALLRRGTATPATLSLADLTVDPATREVARAGRRIELTAREYALLEFLLRNRGRAVRSSRSTSGA